MSDVKLPKQWKHWCKKAGLRPESTGRWARGRWSYMSLRGRGRRWGITCYNDLRVSEGNATFDRWANSEVALVPVPTTEATFMVAVKELYALAIAKDAELAAWIAQQKLLTKSE
jgi:hypothetical protein